MRSLCLVLLCVALSGCSGFGTRYSTEISALSSRAALSKKAYLLLPGAQETSPYDLQYLEFSGYIDKAMASQGFIKVTEPTKAEVIVFLSYGVGDPIARTYSYSVPVYGQTGFYASQKKGKSKTYYTPTYGVTGYTNQIGTEINYVSNISLDAYDNTDLNTPQPQQLWKMEVSSTGQSNDLRMVFPYMVASMKPYIGRNTGQKINVMLKQGAPEVLELTGNNGNKPR